MDNMKRTLNKTVSRAQLGLTGFLGLSSPNQNEARGGQHEDEPYWMKDDFWDGNQGPEPSAPYFGDHHNNNNNIVPIPSTNPELHSDDVPPPYHPPKDRVKIVDNREDPPPYSPPVSPALIESGMNESNAIEMKDRRKSQAPKAVNPQATIGRGIYLISSSGGYRLALLYTFFSRYLISFLKRHSFICMLCINNLFFIYLVFYLLFLPLLFN